MADSPRIEELKRRVQSDPASIAFAALAEEYRRAGRFDEAIDTCTTGLVRHPAYLSARVTLGRAFLDVGRLEDAREELQHVLRLAPENLAAIRGLAEIHDRLGANDQEHSHEPPPETAPAPGMTVAEVHAASGFKPPEPDVSVNAFVPPDPPAIVPSELPRENPPVEAAALAGLEEFLVAIQRARTERAATP